MKSAATAAPPTVSWYRQISRTQWNAFLATFLGWMLDGFDATMLTFLLADIQHSFTVTKAAVGALGS
ncbi:MAG: MFS transporter, partial [Acidobacteria bacterium]|nr:MFS transporter [Acidobacteriota bacterium]